MSLVTWLQKAFNAQRFFFLNLKKRKHSFFPPHVFQCQVLQKDVLRDNTLDYKDCSYIWSTCDISDIKLLQKGHGELAGSMGKGMGTPLHSTVVPAL